MQDIHDIRPPILFGLDPELFQIILAAAVLVLGLLLFFLVRHYMKKRKSVPGQPCLPAPLPPYEAALQQLDLLLQRLNDPRLFYFDLTAILRLYIGRCFGINAIEMTSQEFIRSIKTLDIDRNLKNKISLFQTDCDPFKYAGIVPGKDQAQQDYELVRQMISQIEQDRVKQMEKQEVKQ